MVSTPARFTSATLLRANQVVVQVHLPPCAPDETKVGPREFVLRLGEGLCPGCAARLEVDGDLGYCPSSPGIGWRLDGSVSVTYPVP